MANCNNLFQTFNGEDYLKVSQTKIDKIDLSSEYVRKVITDYFAKHHSKYIPKFYRQGSIKMGTIIRTKDDTCDLDDVGYATYRRKKHMLRLLEVRTVES